MVLSPNWLILLTIKLLTQSCPTLWDPMDCSPPGSSVHGILQARILGWVAISFSRGSSQPRDRTQVSCIVGRCFNLSNYWIDKHNTDQSGNKIVKTFYYSYYYAKEQQQKNPLIYLIYLVTTVYSYTITQGKYCFLGTLCRLFFFFSFS